MKYWLNLFPDIYFSIKIHKITLLLDEETFKFFTKDTYSIRNRYWYLKMIRKQLIYI